MSASHETNSFTSRILKSENILWRDLKFIQADNFKNWETEESKLKLKQSLIYNNFIQPFYVWQDTDNVIYCLDGKHRTILLEELANDGITIPDYLPAIFLDCKDKKEASRLVLIFSSAYAKVSESGFKDFISLYELDLPEILEQISIPALKIEKPLPLPVELDGETKNKPATMKITFPTYQALEAAMPVINELLKKDYSGSFFSVSYGDI